MIYRVFARSREYHLTGTEGIDLKGAYKKFLARLSRDPTRRRTQLLEVLEYNNPGEEPHDDLEEQAFVAAACETFDLRRRGLVEVDLATDSVKALMNQ